MGLWHVGEYGDIWDLVFLLIDDEVCDGDCVEEEDVFELGIKDPNNGVVFELGDLMWMGKSYDSAMSCI